MPRGAAPGRSPGLLHAALKHRADVPKPAEAGWLDLCGARLGSARSIRGRLAGLRCRAWGLEPWAPRLRRPPGQRGLPQSDAVVSVPEPGSRTPSLSSPLCPGAWRQSGTRTGSHAPQPRERAFPAEPRASNLGRSGHAPTAGVARARPSQPRLPGATASQPPDSCQNRRLPWPSPVHGAFA